ncbi:hypothetical protein HPB50_020897 [Hyalomma asiaticum]|uniref:Uncharacterized protein n=1 Tax=Hyalomma asiaticum TaxID=266040 RepID=A0ACB7T8R9_HYAAI|nr:hypothetical protein HPB50_020897 [Hyalomma asiaticum]
MSLAENLAGIFQVMDQWIQRYGKVFGIYLGDKPFMVITDVDIIKECFIKAAKVFQDRSLYGIDAEPFKSGLILLREEKWRKVRSVFNTCFTSVKVKKLSGNIDAAMMRFVQKFDEASRFGEIIEAHDMARRMVLDLLTRTVLGRQSFEVIFKEAENTFFEGSFAYPGLRSLLLCIYPFTSFCKALQKVMDDALPVLKERRSGESERKEDVLQHVVDAQQGIGDILPTTNANARSIDDPTLLSNLAILLIAGFDTTSASLAFLLYQLAKHPEEQLKIRAEIASKLRGKNISACECTNTNLKEQQDLEGEQRQENDNASSPLRPRGTDNPATGTVNAGNQQARHTEVTRPSHTAFNQDTAKNELEEDEVMQLERLDMVVREGLRLYPPIPITIMRDCTEDMTVSGQFIPAGMSVMSPPWHVHRDAEIWSEPNSFIPDRFLQKDRDIASSCYYPFGLGPRMCVAHRLGMVTLKTALYRIMRDFEISLADGVPDPLPVSVEHVILNPAAAIKLKVKKSHL